MSDQSRQPNDPPEDGILLSELLRRAADGELDAELQARLEARLAEHPEDESRIEFERALRAAVGRAMGGVTAPHRLRDRVMRIADETRAVHQHESGQSESPAESSAEEEGALAASLHARAEETRQRSFWVDRARQAVAIVAAAAVLLVVGLFFMQMGSTGSSIGPSTAQAELVTYLSAEHSRCQTDVSYVQSKFTAEQSEVPILFQSILGTHPDLPTLSRAGLALVDAGQCNVPGKGQSVHVRLETMGSDALPPGLPVSLFIQQAAPSDNRFEEGVTYAFESDEHRISDAGEGTIFAWRRNGMNYFLVAEQREICEMFRAEADLPAPRIQGEG